MQYNRKVRVIPMALVLLSTAATLGLLGCDVLSADAAAAAAVGKPAPRRPELIVCGLDRSASYRMVADGAAVCGSAADSMKPGDVLIVHYISDQTYLNSEEVARLDLRDLASRNCEGNPFDHRCTARTRQMRAKMRLRVDSLQLVLASLAPKRAPRTDIIGITAVAADAARALPMHRLRLMIASDMVDNVGYQFKPDLRGARVEVVRFQTGADPAKSDQLRLTIVRQFHGWGAESVLVTTARQQ